MNINQLRAFVTVVEKKSFSAAARALGVSQPAVTLQIQSLEHHLGATLLERRYKSVATTEAGQLLYPAARTILERWQEAEDAVRAQAGLVGGRLTVGGSTTPAHYLLPKLIGSFKREHPQTTVVLHVGDTRETVDRLLAADVDVAFVGEAPKDRRLTCEPFAKDELVLIAAEGSELGEVGERALPLADLAELTFVFREKGSATRDVVEHHLLAHGVSPGDLDVVLELGSSEAVVSAVESGIGVAVVSRFAAEKSIALKSVRVVSAESFPIQRDLFFCTRAKRPASRALEAFLEFARAESAL